MHLDRYDNIHKIALVTTDTETLEAIFHYLDSCGNLTELGQLIVNGIRISIAETIQSIHKAQLDNIEEYLKKLIETKGLLEQDLK